MRLDIVMPAHNEEDRIGRTLSVYSDACTDPDIRFLVAMDHCRDRTAEVVAAHAQDDDRIELFEYPKLGKGGVIAETFRQADADFRAQGGLVRYGQQLAAAIGVAHFVTDTSRNGLGPSPDGQWCNPRAAPWAPGPGRRPTYADGLALRAAW